MILKALLIVHLLADFYMQSKNAVHKKDTEVLSFSNVLHSEHLKHSLIHAVVMLTFLIVIYFQNFDTVLVLLLTLAYFLSHYFIDIVKTQLTRIWSVYKVWLFYADQFLHIGVLLVMHYVITSTLTVNPISVDHVSLINGLLAVLLISNPANVIFQVTFEKFSPKSDNKLSNSANKKENDTHIGFENAGALIGNMERLLIFIMLAYGDVTAIAFVLGI